MTKTYLLNGLKKHMGKIMILLMILLFLFLGLNSLQLYSAWAIKQETTRLLKAAVKAPIDFQNPPSVEDHFDGKLSPEVWKFTNINGGGRVSNDMTWHAAAYTFGHSLVLQHFHDPFFDDESPKRHPPGPEQYNNVAFISKEGFRPSPSKDVVVKFTAWVDRNFYGTAGVVFEPVGTLQNDGFFVKPVDMFGFAVAGEEASISEVEGPFCYLCLDWVPVDMKPVRANHLTPQTYEVRLHWISQTEWLGTVKVEDRVECQMQIPAFGPVEVHVWSDNLLVQSKPRRAWEIAPSTELKFLNYGNKQFFLGMIQIFESIPDALVNSLDH